MPVIELTNRVGVAELGLGRKTWRKFLYDFTTDGGATGAINLRGGTIPSGAIITDALMHVDTAPTSGGAATISVNSEGAGDINAAAAISGAPWSTTGAKRAGALTATAAPIKTTAARTPAITVGTAALTAGKFWVAIEFVEFVTET